MPRALSSPTGCPGRRPSVRDVSEVRLSRDELARRGRPRPPSSSTQLEQYGLLSPRPGSSHYDGDALVVAKTVAEMSRFGIEARHLRPFKTAADREIGLVEQVVTPLVRQRNPEARARADEVARELAALSVRCTPRWSRAGLRPGLTR